MRRLLRRLGRASRGGLAFVGRLARLQWSLARVVFTPSRHHLRLIAKLTLTQARFSGVQAAPLVAALGLIIGAVSILQFVAILSGIADELIGKVLVTIIVREMGPLITAVLVIGRSGTAITTELGTMQLEGELEALRAYRIDPVAFVILPRVLGMVLAMFGLLVLFDVTGLIGGSMLAVTVKDLSAILLRSRMAAALSDADFILSGLKAVLFGQTIAMLSCYFGLQVRRSPTELPQAVTKAVVASLTGVFFCDALLVAGHYFL
ncbi:MAG: ABC transporter permease [Elusimicrobia bacterium]|nr:ABC transporter permease [Elusimicrobiota bacterium]